MQTATLPAIRAPRGVTVTLDETGRDPLVLVTFPARTALPQDFVSACHHLAGEHGASIRFRVV